MTFHALLFKLVRCQIKPKRKKILKGGLTLRLYTMEKRFDKLNKLTSNFLKLI